MLQQFWLNPLKTPIYDLQACRWQTECTPCRGEGASRLLHLTLAHTTVHRFPMHAKLSCRVKLPKITIMNISKQSTKDWNTARNTSIKHFWTLHASSMLQVADRPLHPAGTPSSLFACLQSKLIWSSTWFGKRGNWTPTCFLSEVKANLFYSFSMP